MKDYFLKNFGMQIKNHFLLIIAFSFMSFIYCAEMPQTKEKRVDTAYDAYNRSLRWLKEKQNPDGSWGDKYQTAMTGFALLSYFVAGIAPSREEEEFGETIKKGMFWLADNVQENGMFKQSDSKLYSQLIGSLALSQAYEFTKVPKIKDAAERAVRVIINGQQKGGGFDYGLNPNSSRNNLSFSVWAVHALVVAHSAKLEIKETLPNGRNLLEQACIRSRDGIKANAIGNTAINGFSYVAADGSSHVGLTGAAVYCLYLLGESDSIEYKNGQRFLEKCTFSFDDWGNQPYPKEDNPSPLYYWYFITNAKFNSMGWADWSRKCHKELVSRQIIMPQSNPGSDGKVREMGFWRSPSENESYRGVGPALWKDIMDTTLCLLQFDRIYHIYPAFRNALSIYPVIDEDEDEITISF